MAKKANAAARLKAAQRKETLCPGEEHFMKDAKDLEASAFRRLVARRAREVLAMDVGVVAEKERRDLEKEISRHFEKIHLGADFLPARFLMDGALRARAVCRIVTPTSLGTGFLIARGVLMTNNHVLETAQQAAASSAEFGFEQGLNSISAGIQPGRLFITNVDLDFTIVACDDAQLSEIEPIGLLRNPARTTRSERVSIIQHPAGRRKEVALHDNRVERVLDRVIRYRTDTEPGSSGSPVFNNAWELVALHHAGFNQPGGQALNEGVRISSIVSHLLGESDAAGDESLAEFLASVTDTSPFLGFFDVAGIGKPGSFEIEVPDFTGTPDFADVGVWNIEHFNKNVSNQRVDDVSAVVAGLGMDVLGLTEVDKSALERMVIALRSRGFAMEFELLNVPGSQDLAVLFDVDTTTVKLRPDIANRHKSRLNARTRSGKTAFPRHPLFAECKVSDGNSQDVRFIMIVVHLKAFGDAQSRSRRRLASQKLAEIIEDIRQQEDLPVILGGDFNERLDNDVLSDLTGSPDLFALTADDATDGAISFVGSSHRSLIDHLVVSKDAQLGEISGDDAAIVRLDKSIQDFSAKVSDHVPVVFRMVFRKKPLDLQPADVDEGLRIALPEGASRLVLSFEEN